MRIDIRPARQEDYKDISLLLAEAQSEFACLTEQITENEDIFILLHDKKISGVCAVSRCTDRRYSDYADIAVLYVSKVFRHTGCGRKLLSHTLRKMRTKGYRNAVISVRRELLQAACFLEKFGFNTVQSVSDSGTVTYIIEL